MVLYFSATGNTEYIARQLAAHLNDKCLNLLTPIKNNDYTPLYSDTPFIICAPVYVCEMPRFLSKYLKKLEFCGCRDVYFIFTSGGYCGISGKLARSIFRKKKMNYMGHAEFKMPRNYVASDSYPMLDRQETEDRIIDATKKIPVVASAIQNHQKLTSRHIFLFETLITLPFNPVWCRFKLTAKDFYSTSQCIGCGKCAAVCPLNNIRIQDKRPVWSNSCTHCMACIGNCPAQAIQYGTITLNKEQYNFGKYSYITKSTEVK